MKEDMEDFPVLRRGGEALEALPEALRMAHGSAVRSSVQLVPSMPDNLVYSGMSDGEVYVFLANRARHVRAGHEAAQGGWIRRRFAASVEPYVRIPGAMLGYVLERAQGEPPEGIVNGREYELRLDMAEDFAALFLEAFEAEKKAGEAGR